MNLALMGEPRWPNASEIPMPNKQIVFADRLVGLSIQNGLVRMDLAVNAGQVKDKDGKTGQKMDITTQVVMPLETFAAAVQMQQKMLAEVVSRAQKASKGDKAEKAEKADKA
jgi:hypothetical protein